MAGVPAADVWLNRLEANAYAERMSGLIEDETLFAGDDIVAADLEIFLDKFAKWHKFAKGNQVNFVIFRYLDITGFIH